MNVDLHFHLIPPFFVDELQTSNPWHKSVVSGPEGSMVLKVGKLDFPLAPNHYDTDAMLREMDRMRIDVAAISPSPLLFHHHMDADLVLALHRRINDHLAAIASSHPDRFKPLGVVPMQASDLALNELQRLLDTGLYGLELETNIAGKNLDAKEFWPIYSEIEKRGALIFLHPARVLGFDRLRDYYLSNLIGNPTDTAVAAAALVFGGVMEAHPKLNIVLPHGGGSTPALCGRWDHGTRVRPELEHVGTPPQEQLKHFYYDTLTHSDAALSLLIEVVGTERIVLGSDHPYDMGDYDLVERIERREDLSALQKRAILGENALRLLGERV